MPRSGRPRSRWPTLATALPESPTRSRSPVPKPLIQSTGRRKRAVARVRFQTSTDPGEAVVTVNKRALDSYFPSETHRMIVLEPLRVTQTIESYDVAATIDGGGVSGQAGALRLGIARALAELTSGLSTTYRSRSRRARQ